MQIFCNRFVVTKNEQKLRGIRHGELSLVFHIFENWVVFRADLKKALRFFAIDSKSQQQFEAASEPHSF